MQVLNAVNITTDIRTKVLILLYSVGQQATLVSITKSTNDYDHDHDLAHLGSVLQARSVQQTMVCWSRSLNSVK